MLISEQAKVQKKRAKRKANDHCQWTEWAMVDLEVDRKFFDMVAGANEEVRMQQQNTIEAIAMNDFTNILITDPLTNEAVPALQQLVQQTGLDVRALWTQSEAF